jgi:ketosteroid isomerase-like protein
MKPETVIEMEQGESDMRSNFSALILMFTAAPAMAQTFNTPADVAAIKAVEQHNAELLDADALASAYATDAVVIDYMTGGIYQGRTAIRAGLVPQVAAIKAVQATIREHNIVTDGQFACDMLTTDFRFVGHDGKSGGMSLRQMDALQKVDGRWQIVQQQVAGLNDPKTGKAVTNDLSVRGDMAWPATTTLAKPLSVAEARGQIETWTNASLRVVGIDAIMGYYGPGENEVVMYTPTIPGNVRGKTEMRAYYAPSMNAFESLETKTPILKIDTDGVLGAQIDVQEITLHLHDGKTQPLYWRQSDCVRRVGDSWYGMLDMASFPIDPKTGMTDSKWSGFPLAEKAR